MNPNPPRDPDEGDAAFLSSLQRVTLRPPPPEWRGEILTAAARVSAPASVRWHHSPFWRSMAALWMALLLLQLDTLRVAPAPSAVSSGFTPAVSPMPQPDLQALLVSLNKSRTPRIP